MARKTKTQTDYPIVRNMPIADFYYPGSHSHPVRRKVLVIERSSKIIRGYELREGSVSRAWKDAPIKSYSRSKISKIQDLDKRRVLYRETPENERGKTTLVYRCAVEVIKEGI